MQMKNKLEHEVFRATVEWFWEETRVQDVVGSNPSTKYWMDTFSHHIVKIFAWKPENENEKDSRNGHV